MRWQPVMNLLHAKNFMILQTRLDSQLLLPEKARIIRSIDMPHRMIRMFRKKQPGVGLSPNMLIEFVDGSKTMIEMAAVSNATGLVPDVRGMHGVETDRDHLHYAFALKEDGGVLNKMGVVDFGVGHVAPGVFLIVRTDHPTPA